MGGDEETNSGSPATVAGSGHIEPGRIAPLGAAPSARGVARRIDHLGRIVVPSEYRKTFGIAEGDLIDMTVEGDAIVLRRVHPGCIFCASAADLGLFRGHLVCAGCARELGRS